MLFNAAKHMLSHMKTIKHQEVQTQKKTGPKLAASFKCPTTFPQIPKGSKASDGMYPACPGMVRLL